MSATRSDIERWFDSGVEQRYEFMIVACDTYDYENYPKYATAETFEEVYREATRNMQCVDEVYDLKKDKGEQLSAYRARNYPAGFTP